MSEEKTIYTITSDRNERVFIHAMPGHFVSSSSHLNFYIGTSDIKHNHDISVDAAMMLARYYHERGIEIDTVLCLYETIERAMESVSYYGGETVGISAVFSAINEVDGVEVNKIFSADDVPGYQAYPPHDCPLCKGNQKVDAITNGYGYSLL